MALIVAEREARYQRCVLTGLVYYHCSVLSSWPVLRPQRDGDESIDVKRSVLNCSLRFGRGEGR